MPMPPPPQPQPANPPPVYIVVLVSSFWPAPLMSTAALAASSEGTFFQPFDLSAESTAAIARSWLNWSPKAFWIWM